MTELGGIVTLQLPNHKSGSCGTVVKNVQLKIMDPETGKIVLSPKQSGEIWIKSAIVMNGYYKNPEATKSTIDEEGKQIISTINNNNNNNKNVQLKINNYELID